MALDCSGDVTKYRLDIAFYCVLPLLVRGRALVYAVAGLVEIDGIVRSESCVVIAAKYSGGESASGEELKYACEVVKEYFFVACFDREVEHIFAAGVSEAQELFVPFYALRVDWSHVVVADAFPDFPQRVVFVIIRREGIVYIGRCGDGQGGG